MSELGNKRKKFTIFVADLINFMLAKGYQPMLGRDGLKHMAGSLHYEGLAVDIDLTKDGIYLADGKDHQQFGEYWENLDKDTRWGGRFRDPNHYSVTFGGKS
jgi:hypothetical protein